MKLLTLNPYLATALEMLGCDREDFPGARTLYVLIGPPEILLEPRRRRRPRT